MLPFTCSKFTSKMSIRRHLSSARASFKTTPVRFRMALMAIPVLLVIAAQPARANLDLTFSDRAAWESATSVKGVISFTGLGGAPGDPQFPDKGYPNGLTVD